MADIMSPEQRSERMSRIKGQDTCPELLLRSALHRKGLRYRLHVTGLPGRPDLVFPRHGAVVFIHGCFWHQHKNCKVAKVPQSNTAFWQEKFARNLRRDHSNMRDLRALGWRVAVAWECQITNKAALDRTVERIERFVRGA
ncbi:very short patch repair endonuclease [Ottowia pentelensis]|uniref:Very short patch repair endonuclease n=2 Tax=Ottowia pentelensis TaxID=511108 RepID=A0ABV6PV83_9BURK